MTRIRQTKPFANGYNRITELDEEESNTMMDFGILRLGPNQVEINKEEKERAFLLIQGEVTLEWEEKNVTFQRKSCFEENPWVLHVPQGIKVKITALIESEISVVKTENQRAFTARLYTNQECLSEERGKGTMRETSTRIVRTVFDYSNAPLSNLVIGEVIAFPGKWSSYPPHYHPQPEIYYYRFQPENGFGYCELGEEVIKVKHNDTVKILNVTHPQTAAPGYAMYYIWVIRHLEGNPYTSPKFVSAHTWVSDNEAKIWPATE